MALTINDREIVVLRYSTDQSWYKHIPNENWLCVLVDNNSPQAHVKEVISKILDKNVCYVSAVGENCKENHDALEYEISYREIDLEDLRLPEHFIMTTWHKDFNQAIPLAIFAAYNDEVSIHHVVILDMSAGKETARINVLLTEFAATTAIHG